MAFGLAQACSLHVHLVVVVIACSARVAVLCFFCVTVFALLFA